jgi:hypothetical protein
MPGQPDAFASALLSVAVIAVLVLIWGGWKTWRRGDRQKGMLMMICAVVIAGNVAIWTV